MSLRSRSVIALAILVLVAGFLVPMPSVAVGEEVPPEMIKTVQPEYPIECLKAGYAGNLLLHVVVDDKGRVKEAKVTKMDTYLAESDKSDKENKESDETYNKLHKQFEKAALLAVYQWEFKPGTRDGKPVEMELKIPVEFKFE